MKNGTQINTDYTDLKKQETGFRPFMVPQAAWAAP
jgi:hypothetical protein